MLKIIMNMTDIQTMTVNSITVWLYDVLLSQIIVFIITFRTWSEKNQFGENVIVNIDSEIVSMSKRIDMIFECCSQMANIFERLNLN